MKAYPLKTIITKQDVANVATGFPSWETCLSGFDLVICLESSVLRVDRLVVVVLQMSRTLAEAKLIYFQEDNEYVKGAGDVARRLCWVLLCDELEGPLLFL